MSRYSGMTVNERLYEAGTLAAFDAAIEGRDKAAMIALLVAVEIDPDEAAATAATILSNPTKYGYRPK